MRNAFYAANAKKPAQVMQLAYFAQNRVGQLTILGVLPAEVALMLALKSAFQWIRNIAP